MKGKLSYLLTIIFMAFCCLFVNTKVFAADDTPTFKAVVDTYSNNSLTFYYNTFTYHESNYSKVFTNPNDPGWTTYANKITNIVFDKSFANYKPTSTAHWFKGFTNYRLTASYVDNISNFNTSEVTNMSGMFEGCTEQTINIFLSKLDTSKVTDMSDMFKNCSAANINLNLSNFNTSNVVYMQSMFKDCNKLKTLDISTFDTKNVSRMDEMFSGCTVLTPLSLGGKFTTAKVINMNSMFKDCKALTALSLSKFNTEMVGDMDNMFSGCESIEELNLSNFKTPQLKTCKSMFANCTALKKIDLSNARFDEIGADNNEDMISNCNKELEMKTPNSKFILPTGISSKSNLNGEIYYGVNNMAMKSGEYLTKSETIIYCPLDYTLTLEGNYKGSEVESGIAPQKTTHTVTVGEAFDLKDTELELESVGYIFNGYSKTKDGTDLLDEVSARQYENLTLYGNWTPETYNITYHKCIFLKGKDGLYKNEALEGDTDENANPKTYTYATETSFKDASIDGCEFAGWYEDENCTIPIQRITKVATGNKDVYGKFVDNHTSTEKKNEEISTCMKKGNSGDIYCKVCGELQEKGKELPLADHTPDTPKNAKEATCKEEGNTGTIYCKVCGELIENGTTIPVTPHTPSDTRKNVKEATCIEEGYTGDIHCKDCDIKISDGEIIPKDENNHKHTEIRGAIDVGCVDAGYTGDKYCTDCGKLIETGTVINPVGYHTWDDGKITKKSTPTETGLKVYTCVKCGETKEDILPMHNHEVEIKNDKVATCTEDGYTGDEYCKICGDILAKGRTIPKLSHQHTEVRGQLVANCGVAGYTGDTYCKDCNEKLSTGKIIPATGEHKFVSVITKAPTTKETGIKTTVCTVCGKSSEEVISRLSVENSNEAVNIENIGGTVEPNTPIRTSDSNVTINGGSVSIPDGIISFDKEGTYKIIANEKEYTIVIKETPKPVSTVTPSITETPKQQTVTKTTDTTDTSKTILTKVTSLKVKNVKGKKINISWKKLTGAKKYEIQLATKKSMKKAKKYSTAKNTYTIKKLKKGKTYYVRVRAIDSDNNGPWSKIKKIKIKK